MTVAATKKFVRRHKTAIAVASTAAVSLALHVVAAKEFNNFLREHDLYDAYYE